MPTHPLIPFVESPDVLGKDLLSSSNASMPGAGSSLTPHRNGPPKNVDLDPVGTALPHADCMFCELRFEHQEELGPHVLLEHPTTLFGPTVLRVEAEFRSPGSNWPSVETKISCSPLVAEEEEAAAALSCVVCGQEVADSAEMEIHMKSHKDCYCYCCSLCRRRFKEPWFLKNHMRTHVGKMRGRSLPDVDGPVTINGVVPDQSSLQTTVCAYRQCMICGFFFAGLAALTEHTKMHSHNRDSTGTLEEEVEKRSFKRSDRAEEEPTGQAAFLKLFQLCTADEASKSQGAGRGIALDHIVTYQAWQLDTKGKIATRANIAKELSPDAVSENEDSCSDKEELGQIWASEPGQVVGREEKGAKDGPNGQPLKPSGAETPSPEPDQKQTSSLRKDKPTQCQECGKSFRTYHQLVLHSRIHKRTRVGGESPTPSPDGKACSTGPVASSVLGQAGEYAEEGNEEGSPAQPLLPGKKDVNMNLNVLAPSRVCTYCCKTFRSNYYLNIHLRTHTGEKPFKCKYCDYAAAQKTSLKYHLERRHRDKPYMKIPNIPVSSNTSTFRAKDEEDGEEEEEEEDEEEEPSVPRAEAKAPSHSLAHGPLPPSFPSSPMDSQPDARDGYRPCVKASQSPRPSLVETEAPGGWTPGSGAVLNPGANDALNLIIKGHHVEEASESPLDLSLRCTPGASAMDLSRPQMAANACPSCHFTSLYPEVLTIHQKVLHSDRQEKSRRPKLTSAELKLRRHTGCPPALQGNDASPLVPPHRTYPRRTKSPLRSTPPAAREGQVFSNQASQPPSQGAASSVKIPKLDRPDARLIVPHTNFFVPPKLARGPGKSPAEAAHKPPGATVAEQDLGMLQRGTALTSGHSTMALASSAARLCLSDRFSRIPHRDYSSEPTIKRPRHYDDAGAPEHDGAAHIRPPDAGRLGRLVPPGVMASVASQAGKAAPSAGAVARESDFRTINPHQHLLPSYDTGDAGNLASLYRGKANQVNLHGTVNRPYPHYLSLLQRLEHSQALSPQHPQALSPESKHYQPSERSSS